MTISDAGQPISNLSFFWKEVTRTLSSAGLEYIRLKASHSQFVSTETKMMNHTVILFLCGTVSKCAELAGSLLSARQAQNSF